MLMLYDIVKVDTGNLLGGDVGWGKHYNSRYKSSHDVVILGRPKEKNMKAECKFFIFLIYDFIL